MVAELRRDSGPARKDRRRSGARRQRAGRRARGRGRIHPRRPVRAPTRSAATKSAASRRASGREPASTWSARSGRAASEAAGRTDQLMKSIRYHRYTGDDFGLSSTSKTCCALSDFFLQSGFEIRTCSSASGNEHTLEDAEATPSERRSNAARCSPGRPTVAQLMDDAEALDQSCRSSSSAWSRGLPETSDERLHHHRAAVRRQRGRAARASPSTFEVTDKSVDFLGFKTLQDLLGSLGKSSFGRARHARPGHRRRGQRRVQALRIRRHAESRRQRDAVLARSRREGVKLPLEPRIRRSARPPVPSIRAPARRC